MRKIFLTLLCIMAISANAARIVNGINYEINRDNMTAAVIKLDYPQKYTGDIVIPETIVIGDYEFDVVGISKEAFEGCNITSISLPNSVYYINDNAFADCTKLTSISLPDGIKIIGNEAFYNCRNVTNLKLPNNDVKILDRAFAYMQSLKELVFPDKWTELGYESCSDFFMGCTSLRKVVIGKGIVVIWSRAFYECESLNEVVCYDDGSLEAIGSEVFAYTAMTSMRFLPKTLTAIVGNAFDNCKGLTEAFIPASVVEYGAGSYHYNCTTLVLEDTAVPLGVAKECYTNFKEMYLGRPIDESYNLPYSTSGINNTKNSNAWMIEKLTFGPNFKGGTKWQFGYGVKEIYSYVTDPSVITCKFTNNVYDNATLYVPKGTKAAYAAQSNFAPFFDIREMAGKPDVGSVHNLTVGNNELAFKVTNNYPMEVEVSAANQGQVSGALTIPKTIEIDGYTYSVTSIGEQAFIYCRDLTSVTIPNSVTSIGGFAFCYCSGLTSVTIPKSVTSIGIAVFVSCSLTSIIVESGNTTYDSRNKCNAIIETKTNNLIAGCKNTIIPNSVTCIGWGAFNNCIGLTSVTIPNSVTSIGDHAFEQCTDLTSVTIGNSVTSIGDAAFASCKGLTSVSIGNSVTSIGDEAFTGCRSLTSVAIGNSVISIGDGAFQFCSSLTSVTIGNSVTSIGKCAFFNTMLQHVYCYAEQVPWVGADAFSASIRKATLHVSAGSVNAYKNTSPWSYFGSIVAIGGQKPAVGTVCNVTVGDKELAFKVTNNEKMQVEVYNNNVNISGEISIPETVVIDGYTYSVTSIGNFAFNRCWLLTSITIPNSVTSIGKSAFFGCYGLTSMTIPNSVTSIGDSAFGECIGLTSVTIPNSVTTIGDHAFEDCHSLTSVTIPNSVTTIGDHAFYGCRSLTSVTIPNSVTSIGTYAFRDCSGLTSVTIGNSVTNIGWYAFQYCSSLNDVYCYANQVPNTNQDAFDSSSVGNATLHVPAGSVNAYNNTAPWSGFGNIVALEEGDQSGIEAIKNGEQKDNAPVYNLNGQHVDTPQKGIYIKNGRKVLMK